jgi:hypothetical protein
LLTFGIPSSAIKVSGQTRCLKGAASGGRPDPLAIEPGRPIALDGAASRPQLHHRPPAELGQAVQDLVDGCEARESLEAQLADADKLECLIQAREYQAQGYQDVPPWIETSAAVLQSPSAKQLAEACQ